MIVDPNEWNISPFCAMCSASVVLYSGGYKCSGCGHVCSDHAAEVEERWQAHMAAADGGFEG